MGSAIGAVGALLGSLIAGLFALRNEARRQADARQLAYAQKVREQVGRGLQALFFLHHSIAWFTWYAKNDPAKLDSERVALYEVETHSSIPKLMGEMAVVASLNPELWERSVKIVGDLLDLEEQVAIHGSRLSTDREDALRNLSTLNAKLRSTMQVAVSQITDLMRDAERLLPDFGTRRRT